MVGESKGMGLSVPDCEVIGGPVTEGHEWSLLGCEDGVRFNSTKVSRWVIAEGEWW